MSAVNKTSTSKHRTLGYIGLSVLGACIGAFVACCHCGGRS